jgi:acetylornithine/N-succinyldiaminopimelate aminotransferase
MRRIFPPHLAKFFFQSSGAEANDAAIKLARKASGKRNVISAEMSFHGRTISTASATGQAFQREKYDPLMPHYRFVPFGSVKAVEDAIDSDTAAVIIEPIQGEGGIRIAEAQYLESLDAVCKHHGVYLIIDEIQTGFYRTGPLFAVNRYSVKPDFLTMAKGIAGGYPFAAFAMTEEVASLLTYGDHGGTYCGNPLGCAVAHAVISHMIETKISENVTLIGEFLLDELNGIKKEFHAAVKDVRGLGLLTAMEFFEDRLAVEIQTACMEMGLLLNLTQGNVIRFFPALNINISEAKEGLNILKSAIKSKL